MTWLLVEPVPVTGEPEGPPSRPDLLYRALFGTDHLPCTIAGSADLDDWVREGRGHYGEPTRGVLWVEVSAIRGSGTPMHVEHTAVGLPGTELRWYHRWAKGGQYDHSVFENDRLVVRFADEDARLRFAAAFTTAFGFPPELTPTYPPRLHRHEPPAEHLRLIGEDPSWDRLLELAGDPATDPDVLVSLYLHPEVERVRADVAADPYLATDYPGHHEHGAREYFLNRLSWLLAAHPRVGEDLLGELATAVLNAWSIVHNPAATAGPLELLARTVLDRQDTAVGPATVAAHPNAGPGTLEFVALNGRFRHEFEAVLAHPDASPRAAAVARFRLDALAHRAADPTDATDPTAGGDGGAVPDEAALLRLVATRRTPALIDLACHPGTPTSVLDLVAARCEGLPVLVRLARHRNASPDALEAVARHVVWHHGHNRHADPELCRQAYRALRVHPTVLAADRDLLAPFTAAGAHDALS